MNSTRSHTTFFDLFPPLRFLEMPSAGLDISDRMIRFVELKRAGSRFSVGRFGETPLPHGLIEEGYVKDVQGLAKVLGELKQKHNLSFIKASLPDEKSYEFKTEVPVMPIADLRAALKFKIEENVPISFDNAVYDYKLLKEPEAGDEHMDVVVTVIHQKVPAAYLEAFEKAGLIPLELKTESQAVAACVIPKGDMETHAIAAIRENKTVLSIVSRGAIHYSTTLAIGGESIAESIKKSFSIDDKETELIRQGREMRDSNEMFMALVNAASVLRDEMQKVFSYWETHGQDRNGKNPIKDIIISGSDSMLGLDDYLARSFNMPVRVANAWENILSVDEALPALTRRESLDFVPALGLALPYD